jgi:glycosyltransferase involved in cell wall biosynthesis
MKIIQVVPYFPPHIGGEETYVYSLSRELAARGHEVTVLTSLESGLCKNENISGVKIHRIKVLMKVYNNPVAPSLFAKLIQEDAKNCVLHAHQYPIFFSDVSAFVSLTRHIPFILHVHVIPEPKSFSSSIPLTLYYKLLWKLTLKPTCRIIVPSFAYRKLLLNLGVAAKKIRVVPYAIDTYKFHPKNDGSNFKKKVACEGFKIILTVGRLNYQKGLHVLIKALPLIKNQFKDIKLIIVGEGEERKHLQDLTMRLNVDENVVFTGALHNDELPQAYACADVFVLPSFFESFGITFLEAQATGKPIVGTNVGGVPEAVLNRESGLLIEPGNVKDLAQAVITILSDREMAKRMGERGRKHVEENFSWYIAVDKIVSLYKEILQNDE